MSEDLLFDKARADSVTLSVPCTSRDLFRALVLVEPRTSRILLAPTLGDEVRFEATEVFLGVYRDWERRPVDGGAVELRKMLPPAPPGRWLSPEQVAHFANAHDNEMGTIIHSPPGKRIVSLSVFGDSRSGTDFWKQMPAFVETYALAHHALFPGYELRVHHDEWLYSTNGGNVLCALARRGLIKLVYVPSRPETGKCQKMLWRLLPAWDPEVAHVFMRDVDALPTWKERCCVEEFIASECAVGVIHDNVMHSRMMGGLSHVDARQFRQAVGEGLTFGDFIASAGFSDKRWAKHGADQDFLDAWVSSTKMTVLEHSLCDASVDGGGRAHRGAPTIPGADFRTEVAPYDDSRVPAEVRERSGDFINYLGAAGYRASEAWTYYNNLNGPVTEALHTTWPAVRSRVVISSDDNLNYSFYTPICSLFWRLRGYRPLLFLVGSVEHWLSDPRLRLALERSREVGAEIYFVPEIEGVRDSTVAQVVRLFGACAPHVADEDHVLTADVDMLPIGDWVGGGRDANQALQLWYANAYRGSDYLHFPICYVGAQASTWREIVGCGPGAWRAGLLSCLSQAPEDESGAWNFDERWLGERIAAWPSYPERTQEIDRNFVEGEWRIDRSQWDEAMRERESLDGVADAHLIRPGYTDENWRRLRPLLALALPAEWLAWVDEYREAWVGS